MDFKTAFHNTITLPCKVCRVASDKHHHIYDHNFVSPLSDKDRTTVKTQRGMLNDNIRDLEIYNKNNDYGSHISRLDMSASFRSGSGKDYNDYNEYGGYGINSKKNNKKIQHEQKSISIGTHIHTGIGMNKGIDKFIKKTIQPSLQSPKGETSLRGALDLSLNRDLDGHNARQTCDQIPSNRSAYIGKKNTSCSIKKSKQTNICNICNLKESEHKGFSHKFLYMAI